MRFAKVAVVAGLVMLFAEPIVAANQPHRGGLAGWAQALSRSTRPSP